MDYLWNFFINCGSVEAYLGYKEFEKQNEACLNESLKIDVGRCDNGDFKIPWNNY